MEQLCPTCSREVAANSRYPTYLCEECVERATDADGGALEFLQDGPFGDYAARYRSSGFDYPSHECFVDGKRCRADVARFGGIVVQPT